jgi:thiamine biosynthesis lipoprotein
VTVPVRRVEHVMGMPVSLAVRGAAAGSQDADDAWEEAVRILRHVDETFSTYRDDSWIARLGQAEVTLAQCPPDVREVLALAERARVESHGAFDVWAVGTGTAGRLDPSGVVKGWAVQRAFAAFDGLDGTDVCLSAGGDLVCTARADDSPGWRIGIEDPIDPSRTVAVVPIRDGAIATSGRTHRGAHILDPRTGRPATGWASVTVISDELTWADIDATAAYVLGTCAEAWLTSRARTGVLVEHTGTARVFGP